VTIEEVKAIIRRYIAECDRGIEESRASIRESYANMQTNVDACREAIKRYEQQKLALQIVLEEIEDEQCCMADRVAQEEEKT
jgi:hypothetical protein